MRTLTIKGRDGQVRIVAAPANGDLSNILGDGETLIVPTMFMDSANGISQRGYVMDDDTTVNVVTDEERRRLEDARVAARTDWIGRVNGAWKKPKTNDAARNRIFPGVIVSSVSPFLRCGGSGAVITCIATNGLESSVAIV